MHTGAPADISISSIESRFNDISPLLLVLKYQQQIISAIIAILLPLCIPLALMAAVVLATGDGFAALGFAHLLTLITAFVLGLLYLVIERVVNRIGIAGGILGLVIALLTLLFVIIGTLSAVEVIADLADTIGSISVVASVLFTTSNLFLVGIMWMFSLSLFKSSINIFRLSPKERAVIQDIPPRNEASGLLLTRIWGMPPTYQFATKSRWRFAALVGCSVCATFFFAMASLSVIGGPMAVFKTLRPIAKECRATEWVNDGNAWHNACLSENLLFFITLPVVLALLIVVIVVLGGTFQRTAQRLATISLIDLQTSDPRPPILFLRAFRDDQVPLEPTNSPWIARLLEAGRRTTTLDHTLLNEATIYGPVVGLGSPSDRLPPYGAARGYFEDVAWQDAVASLAHDSAAILS